MNNKWTVVGCIIIVILPILVTAITANEVRIYHISDECVGCGACADVCDEIICENGSAVFRTTLTKTHQTSDSNLHECYDEAADECPFNFIWYN